MKLRTKHNILLITATLLVVVGSLLTLFSMTDPM